MKFSGKGRASSFLSLPKGKSEYHFPPFQETRTLSTFLSTHQGRQCRGPGSTGTQWDPEGKNLLSNDFHSPFGQTNSMVLGLWVLPETVLGITNASSSGRSARRPILKESPFTSCVDWAMGLLIEGIQKVTSRCLRTCEGLTENQKLQGSIHPCQEKEDEKS